MDEEQLKETNKLKMLKNSDLENLSSLIFNTDPTDETMEFIVNKVAAEKHWLDLVSGRRS